jgi:DHA2 family multidrug resistance protein-like MFS transporter
LVAAIGYGVLTQISPGGPLWILILGFMLFCAGLAPMGALTTDLVMSDVPPERAGAASGISETSFEFGAALGIAVLGSIVGAIYRAQMSAVHLPELSSEVTRAARETLGAAMEIASSIEGEARSVLESAARDAFTHGMHVASLASAALALAAAFVCWRFMSQKKAAMSVAPELRAEGES